MRFACQVAWYALLLVSCRGGNEHDVMCNSFSIIMFSDKTIVETCLREMMEEISGLEFDFHETGGGRGVSVLGVLRCNWGEVHHMVGVAGE